MATFTGQKPKDTYESLLHIASNNDLTGSLQYVQDGYGNNTTIRVSLNEVELTNTILSGLLTLSSPLSTSNGGLGVALSDPNADKLIFWDDSAGQHQYLTLGSNLSITGTTIDATASQNVFSTIAVSGQSNVVADSTSDTLTLVAGSNVTITTDAGADSVTIASSGSTMTWNVISGLTSTAVVNTGHFSNNASQVDITLPASFAVGDIIEIAGLGAGGWKLSQNSGQIIYFGDMNTTTGVGGYLASTHQRDAIRLVGCVANTDLMVLSSQGNITIV